MLPGCLQESCRHPVPPMPRFVYEKEKKNAYLWKYPNDIATFPSKVPGTFISCNYFSRNWKVPSGRCGFCFYHKLPMIREVSRIKWQLFLECQSCVWQFNDDTGLRLHPICCILSSVSPCWCDEAHCTKYKQVLFLQTGGWNNILWGFEQSEMFLPHFQIHCKFWPLPLRSKYNECGGSLSNARQIKVCCTCSDNKDSMLSLSSPFKDR